MILHSRMFAEFRSAQEQTAGCSRSSIFDAAIAIPVPGVGLLEHILFPRSPLPPLHPQDANKHETIDRL
jgi:hypothetical protein